MKEIQAYTHLIYDLSGMIHKLRMKDIQMESGLKLSSAALSMLNVIDRNPGMSVTELSKRMNMTKSAISQMLKKLCTLGLTKKNRNDCNGKNLYPELTETGIRTAVEYREKHDRFYVCIGGILSRFDENEQDTIYRFLLSADEKIKEFALTVEQNDKDEADHAE